MLRTGCMGTMVVVQVALILTVSFFVLLSMHKLDSKSKRLKVFGYVIASLLWLCAAIVLSTGIYSIVTGKSLREQKMHRMMKMKDWKHHSSMKAPMHSEMKNR